MKEKEVAKELIFKGIQGLEVKLKRIEASKGLVEQKLGICKNWKWDAVQGQNTTRVPGHGKQRKGAIRRRSSLGLQVSENLYNLSVNDEVMNGYTYNDMNSKETGVCSQKSPVCCGSFKYSKLRKRAFAGTDRPFAHGRKMTQNGQFLKVFKFSLGSFIPFIWEVKGKRSGRRQPRTLIRVSHQTLSDVLFCAMCPREKSVRNGEYSTEFIPDGREQRKMLALTSPTGLRLTYFLENLPLIAFQPGLIFIEEVLTMILSRVLSVRIAWVCLCMFFSLVRSPWLYYYMCGGSGISCSRWLCYMQNGCCGLILSGLGRRLRRPVKNAVESSLILHQTCNRPPPPPPLPPPPPPPPRPPPLPKPPPFPPPPPKPPPPPPPKPPPPIPPPPMPPPKPRTPKTTTTT
ncbi:hypothetical protein LXL04_033259 [Taraxacum kok-saghyz]